jgi:hypothetical protein
MFLSTEASTSQWESSVFVSPIKAPALMILDEYGAAGRCRFSVLSVFLVTMLDPCNAVTIVRLCRLHCCVFGVWMQRGHLMHTGL